MTSITTIIFHILIFASVYVQVFFFVTFLENRKRIIIRKGKVVLDKYPAVTIVVPCWNEERTVYKTVRSLMNLNYPKDKLEIFLIDDGSTDRTWDIIRKFEKYSNIKVFHKENGGKYAALNFALEHMTTQFFAGLDADSLADPEALVRIMSTFQADPSVMAVVPSVTVCNAKNFIQNAQRAEYHMGVYFKKMLSFMGAINVTPGPLTVFRKKVFDDLGPYKHAHNTEDMEIAYRMQKNHYKIEHCNDAYIYTNTPKTIRTLYKQRLRWVYGFINNTIDYRNVLFRKKYGNFSLFTLPMGALSIISVTYLFGRIIYNVFDFLYSKIVVYQTVGFNFNSSKFAFSFDPFFINTKFTLFLVVVIYATVVFAMVFGRRMAENKWSVSLSMLYYFPVFSVLAPLWLVKAMYKTITNRRPPAWR